VPSYSTLWAAVGALAWPVTVLGYAETCGSHLEWLGTVWPPGTRASVARGSISIKSVGLGGKPPSWVEWREASSLGVRRGGKCGPGVG
jgi:hypothetical protein